MAQRRIVVVGAGIGGLCAAATLAARGLDVTVVEQHGAPGGKMREMVVQDAHVDAGPTVLTMPWVFEELFAACGDDFSRAVSIVPAAVLARHAWPDGSRLDLHADRRRSAEEIGRFAGRTAALGYERFCADAERIYRMLEPIFLRAPRTTPLGLVRRYGIARAHHLLALSSFDTLWRKLGRYFEDPRLRQLFGRYATYCGSSPYAAPATLMLVAHVEQAGVWYVEGGMHRIARAVASLAARHGARLRYGARVREIGVAGGSVRCIVLASGERVAADAVIANADPALLAQGALGQAAARALRPLEGEVRSLSALTWCARTTTRGFELLRHNVFFSDDYAAEFRALFGDGAMPAAPTIYVCAQDRGDDARTVPAGPERLLCLINAPARTATDAGGAQAGLAAFHARRVQATLQRFGLQLDVGLEKSQAATPRDFESSFGAPGGALYGAATHGWRSTFRRPGARTAVNGLYLAGGGTHPGPGVPMAALSGRLAAEALLADLAGRMDA